MLPFKSYYGEFEHLNCYTGALELEGVEVQVQLGDKKDIKDLIPKKVK